MRRTQLYIKVNNQWSEIDLFDDIVVPITMKVTDIRKFGSKTSSFSLDFDIPHTNNNAQVFGLNADINVYESTFEVGKDYPAYMTSDTFTTFEGQFRLKKVIKRNNGAYIYYVGYLYGGSKNFVDALGTYKLTGNDDPTKDLNFSEHNTPASEMTLSDFYSYLQSHHTDGTGWGLTLIDKTNKASQAFSGGSQQWYTDECTPYLYAREIFDKLFTGSGYSYVSEFLQGTDFSTYLQDPRWAGTIGKYDVNSIIYPYMKHNSNLRTINPVSSVLSQIDQNATSTLFSSSVPVSYPFTNYTMINGSNNIYTVNFDSNDYSIVNNRVSVSLNDWKFTCPSSGLYHIEVNLPFKLRTQFYKDFYSELYTSRATNNDTTQGFTYWFSLMKNNRVITEFAEHQNYPAHYTVDSHGWTDLVGEQTISYSDDIRLNAGDTIQLYAALDIQWYRQVWWESTGEYINVYAFRTNETIDTALRPINMSFMALTSSSDTIVSIVQNDGFYEENDFYPNCILNPKTTKLDFFNTFVKMFNLYVEDVSGKKNYKTGDIYPPNTLRIEPYEIFYAPELGSGQSNTKDWTDKIDWASVEYRRCDDYLYNIQSFTKKQDKDFYNDNYDTTYITPYGNREVKGVYCTSDERNEIALNVSANLCGIVNNSTDVLQCPKVFAIDKSGNIDTKKEYSDGLFFIWRNYMSANTSLTTNYTLKLQSRIHTGHGSYYNMTDYYCADTLNKGYGLDDANLNWGGTEMYYQNMKGTIPTYNDLYSAFYSREYEEKTAQDARIMRANAYLTAQDIYNLQLSDLIVCHGDYWHILEVNQWKDEKTPCQIELLKTRPVGTGGSVRQKITTNDPQNTLPVTTDMSTLLQQLNNANEQIAELNEQISAREPADSVPMRVIFQDKPKNKTLVLNAKVSDPDVFKRDNKYGNWDKGIVTMDEGEFVVLMNREAKTYPPMFGGLACASRPLESVECKCKLKTPPLQLPPKKARSERFSSICKKSRFSTDDKTVKRGFYSAIWDNEYAVKLRKDET